MRISSGMIWSSVLSSTNRALSDYYALAEQNSSTKKVNRPSDDPAGTGSILNLRDHLAQMEQQQENIDTARGWLTQADDALNSMSEQIISCEELCEQAATGTLDADQRLMVAEQVREALFEHAGHRQHRVRGRQHLRRAGDRLQRLRDGPGGRRHRRHPHRRRRPVRGGRGRDVHPGGVPGRRHRGRRGLRGYRIPLLRRRRATPGPRPPWRRGTPRWTWAPRRWSWPTER